MVSPRIDQKQQQQNSVTKEPKQADTSLSAPKAQNFIKPDQMARPAEDVMRMRALLNSKTAQESRKVERAQKSADKQGKHGHTVGGETVAHERSDRIAFKLVGAPANAQVRQPVNVKERSKDAWSRAQGRPGEEHDHATEIKKLGTASASPLTSTANAETGASAANRFSDPKNTNHGTQAAQVGASGGASAESAVSHGPKQEVVKLLELVGPEAVLTLKERLKEVWVNLDNTPNTDLDVIARMPASVHGLSSADLLTIKSPQGVHFVAFLKNRNDFEVLQTFDRHALLPTDPNRQLLEAAVMAYEQLGTVCKAGAEQMESRVKKLGSQQQIDQLVFDGLRRQCVVAKRRSRKCSDLVEQLVDEIDDLMLDEKLDEAHEMNVPDQKEERIIKPENERPVLKNDGDE